MLFLSLLACTGPADDKIDTATDTDLPADTDTGDTAIVEDDTCAPRGLTRREWDGSGVDGEFETVAPDFTLNLLDGTTFVWSERFTGCDSVISITYDPAADYPNLTRPGDVRDWLETSPRSVHYLISIDSLRAADREAALTALKDTIDTAISRIDDEEAQAFWTEHVHLVTDNPNNPDSAEWIGNLNQTYRTTFPVNWGIDRFGMVRELGYLADPNTGWEESPPSFITYEAEWFDYESDLQDRLDADGATVLRAFEYTDSRVVSLEFPDAATMATFDTLELDMRFICNGHPDSSGCGEWDYLAYAYLCDNDDPATTDVDESGTCTEIGRFITAYARPGRWLVDATPFLAMVKDGGTHVIRVNSANAPFITFDLRLSNQGKGQRPVAIEYLWSGGTWDSNYNVGREPITFTPPTGATGVGIWTLISGHGFGSDRENCAEFCNHQHEFVVNEGLTVMQEFPEAGTAYGCAETIGTGTVSGQYGTWVLGRGGWCPGRQVDPWSADLTSAVDFSGENTITYRGLFEGDTYVPVPIDNTSGGFGGRADVASWLVFYE
ncbi:MAG: peptide-N-glycosidase F-related protein [Myxococcota bacterium]